MNLYLISNIITCACAFSALFTALSYAIILLSRYQKALAGKKPKKTEEE